MNKILLTTLVLMGVVAANAVETNTNAKTPTTTAAAAPVKKKIPWWNIVAKFKQLGEASSKENTDAINSAENGTMVAGTRKVASDPKAKKIQTNMDKQRQQSIDAVTQAMGE